jgi:Na+/H+-dicarboxylate symporter
VVGRVSPLRFFQRSRAALVTAFSTSSSNATLPTALAVTQEELGVSKKVSSFVLTIGATANQNGTALFEGLTILFLAQVFGVELSLMQQATVLVLAIVAGIGTAGVPAGSIPFIIVLMGQLGIPVEGIAIVLGVDRLLDMCRTVVNVSGDMAAAVIIARKEGEETNLV